MTDAAALLEEAERAVSSRWSALENWLSVRFGRDPGLESILFLIGVQVRGTGYQPQLEKDAKQDLIMEGARVVLEAIGLSGDRSDFVFRNEPSGANPPPETPGLTVEQQERLLKLGALRYFEQFMDSP